MAAVTEKANKLVSFRYPRAGRAAVIIEKKEGGLGNATQTGVEGYNNRRSRKETKARRKLKLKGAK